MKLHNYSIKKLFFVSQLLIVILVSLISVAYNVYAEFEEMDNELKYGMLQEADALQGVVGDLLKQNQLNEIQRLILSLSARKYFVSSWVSDNTGKIIASDKRKNLGLSQNEILNSMNIKPPAIKEKGYFQSGDYSLVYYSIKNAGLNEKLTPDKDAQYWMIYESRSQKMSAIKSTVTQSLIFGVLIFMFLFGFFTLFYRSAAVRLNKIIDAAIIFRTGKDADTSNVSFRVEGKDEIAVIASTLDKMAKIIKNEHKLVRQSEERLNLALEGTGLGLWDWNISSGKMVYNENWCSLIGYKSNEIEPNVESWFSRIHPEDKESILKILDQHLNGETPYYESRHRLKTKDGGWKWILSRGKVVDWTSEGKPLRVTGTHRDISKEMEYQFRIEEIAIKDKLTGVFNRHYFEEVFQHEINRAFREKRYFCFIIFDIDFFKQYNDTYGHPAGDLVLSKIGELMTRQLQRSGDTMFRLGGEEFGVIPNVKEHDDCVTVSERLRKEVQNLKIRHEASYVADSITISLGVCNIKPGLSLPNANDVYKSADEALYKAKNAGRNRVFYRHM